MRWAVFIVVFGVISALYVLPIKIPPMLMPAQSEREDLCVRPLPLLWLVLTLSRGEAIIATIFGILIGPYCAGWFSPLTWNSGNGIDESQYASFSIYRSR